MYKTILDSMFIWDTIGEDYLRSLGKEPKENLKETFKTFTLEHAAEYYRENYGVTLSVNEIIDGVNKMVERYYAETVKLKSGIEVFLEKLKAKGVKMCIATRIYNHIIPKIGKIPLNELTQNDLQKFYNSLKKDGRLRYRDTLGEGLSDRFVRSCHANCRTALQKATDDRLIKKNPAIGCKIPPKKSREMQVLTLDEIKRFLIQAKYDGFFEIFLVALSTGLRRGEDTALKWEDLNLDTGELKVRRQVKRTKGRLVITEPKTEESVRTIILPKSLVTILKEYKETIDSEWMFPSPRVEGMPRDPSAVYGMMQVILERAECKKVRFHALRHTFATTSVANGMDIKTLSTILGHVSSKTTLDIYLHSTEEMKKEAAEKINARFNKDTNDNEETIADEQEKPPQAKFEPKKGKMRKPGTGCISKINDHLYEGRYSPKDAYGKRMARNIYAPTREECEEKLAILIKEMKAEIAEQKAKLKNA